MKIRFLLALASLAIATPASAVTILMTPDEPYHDAYIARATYLDTGVYLARFAFDRPVVAGHLTFIHGRTYDFWGVEDGEHYGGNDIPLFRDAEFDGQLFTSIIRIERPYLRHHHWGRIGAIQEYGYYYLEATLGDFVFANAEPVRLDYSFERLSAVPEPASWAMLITGFGAVGWAMRRRRAGPQMLQ